MIFNPIKYRNKPHLTKRFSKLCFAIRLRSILYLMRSQVCLFLFLIATVMCCSSGYLEVTVIRRYTTYPEEEKVYIFNSSTNREILSLSNSLLPNWSQTYIVCVEPNTYYTLRLVDTYKDGWSPGSYVTVRFGSQILFNQYRLLNGYYSAEEQFIIYQNAAIDFWVWFIIGGSIAVVIVIIVALVKACTKKPTLPKTSSVSFVCYEIQIRYCLSNNHNYYVVSK